MRAVILAVVCGLALAATPLQAAPVPTKALPGELGVAPPVEPVRDAAGTATTGATNGAIGDGVTALLTEVLMAATARGRTIRPPFGAAPAPWGWGW
jgi:hypothetical protein